jgi:hypothetical protein
VDSSAEVEASVWDAAGADVEASVAAVGPVFLEGSAGAEAATPEAATGRGSRIVMLP